VRNPNYRASTDSRASRESNPTRSSSPSTPTSTTSTTRSAQASSTTHTQPRPEGLPRVHGQPEQAEVPALELRRWHVLRHDEPHSAAIRRRARPTGDELGDGSKRAPEGSGAARSLATSASTSSRTRCSSGSWTTSHPSRRPAVEGASRGHVRR
jgi:hypothetical protein